MSDGPRRDQTVTFERDGVVTHAQVLDRAEVSRYRSEVQRLVAGDSRAPGSVQFSQPHLYFRWAYELVQHPRIVETVAPLVGPDILAHSTTIFYKAPRDPGFVSWHQDGHYWGLEPPELITAWLALTDSTRANGCLRVVLGSHRSGAMPHGETAISPDNLLRSGLQIQSSVDADRVRDLELRAGDLSLHHLHMIHGSNPNGTDEERIGLTIRYAPPHVRQALPHPPVVLVRGRDRWHNFEVMDDAPDMTAAEGIRAEARLHRRAREIRSLGAARGSAAE